MPKKKKKSKFKKIVKNLLKAAAVGAVGYGASKMFGGKKKFGTDAGFLKSAAAGGASLSSPPILGTDHIKKAVVADAADTGPVLNVTGGIHANKPAKGAMLKERRYSALNKIPPSMRGGAKHAQGWTPGVYSGNISQYDYRAKGGRAGHKKGGSVTGIAKRGFGRALMKGKK
jgi:hypothetical protein